MFDRLIVKPLPHFGDKTLGQFVPGSHVQTHNHGMCEVLGIRIAYQRVKEGLSCLARGLRLGQSVELESDLYGGSVTYHGKVVGMAGGTGAAFALIPAQNATGNWVKVVQRLPVRIALDDTEVKAHPLRVGLSMTAVVDTRE